MATGSFRLPSGGSTVTAYDWVRPSDWLAMPTIGTQEFIGLLAITNDESNHIALLCAGAIKAKAIPINVIGSILLIGIVILQNFNRLIYFNPIRYITV